MYTVYNVYAICAFAAIGGGLFGFDISSMSGVLGTEAYTNYFDVHGQYRQGAITGSMPAGSFLGTIISFFIANNISRRTWIQVAAIVWIIGSILQTSANGVPLLVVGRITAGVGIGIASTMVPIYQAEIAPKEIRGRVVSLQQWAITWGILIQYFIQYGASFTGGGADNIHQGTSAFRIPWAVQIVPAAVLFLGMFFLPYTPRWLAAQDRWEEAIRVLANLHGHGDIGHPNVLAQYREIEEVLRFEREEALNTMRALTQPRMINRVVLGMSIQMWSQLGGMNMMMYYIVYLMQSAGIGDPLLTASIQYILNVALTLPAILFLDTWGRRPSLLLGALGQGACLFLIGGLEAYYGSPNTHTDPNTAAISWVLLDHPSVSRAVIALSYLFVSIFAITWGPTSWVYASEIFPSGIRAKAVSLSTASNWMWNTAIGFAVPPLLWSINWKMYMIFGAFNMLAFVHVFFAAPETKGKTLEEMDDVFDVRRPAWERRESGSRLDELQREIEAGEVKVVAPVVTEVGGGDR